MNLKDKLEGHFQRLIDEGRNTLQKYERSDGMSPPRISSLEYNKWYSSAKNLIERVCGKDGIHCKQIEDIYTRTHGSSVAMPSCLGVLESAYEDFKLGLLEDTTAMITAEVFADFIEQAEYLLDEGYNLPAAVLMRGVLEDSLRTLCKKEQIVLSEKSKLDWMNTELVKAGVYNTNVQKQVTAWAGIGNSAAHMKIDEFSETDVKNMISGIISFNATFLK
jgi:hypothetical protein